MEVDYYKVLGICNDATPQEIKQGYRNTALAHHPKRQQIPRPLSPSICAKEQKKIRERMATEEFQYFYLCGEAYEVLINPIRKLIYDTHGERGLKEGLPGPQGFIAPYAYHGDPYRTFNEFFGTDNPFVDLLDNLCTNVDDPLISKSSGFKPKQPPVYRDLWLTLEELYTGCLKKIMTRKNTLDENGQLHCPDGHDKVLTVAVEAGTPAGTEYVFPNEGDQGPSIQPADIIFVIREQKHDAYRRVGNNLYYHVDVNLGESLCGMIIPIVTLDNRFFNVSVVDIIRPGYEKVVVGEGFPILGQPGRKGDLIMQFETKYPQSLSQLQRKNLRCTFGLS